MALMAWPTTDRRQWSARRQRGCLGAVRPNRKQASAMLSQLNKGEDWVEPHRPPPTEGRGGRVPANTVELLRKEIYGISSLSTTPPPSILVAVSHFRGGAAIAGGQPRCAKCRRGLEVPRYLGRFEVAELVEHYCLGSGLVEHYYPGSGLAEHYCSSFGLAKHCCLGFGLAEHCYSNSRLLSTTAWVLDWSSNAAQVMHYYYYLGFGCWDQLTLKGGWVN
ncbi:hypothetical protein GW17_00053812 [Ensete ventricosum]|nr:hypothetical protein GW17_00053812 [Ensete ventricosum]